MNLRAIKHAVLATAALGSFVFLAGCSRPEPLLKEQADLVCACTTYECGMGVLEGPINQKLKAMDKGRLLPVSEKAKAEKVRMMGCLLALKSKDLEGPGAGAAASASGTASGSAPSGTGSAPAGTFTSAEGGYTIRFPFSAPEEKVTIDFKKIAWHEAKSDIGAYAVMWSDFASPAKAKAYVDEFVKTSGARANKNEAVTVAGMTGRELEMTISPSATMWLRIVTKGSRVYKMSAGTKNDHDKALAFLDTFALREDGVGAATTTGATIKGAKRN